MNQYSLYHIFVISMVTMRLKGRINLCNGGKVKETKKESTLTTRTGLLTQEFIEKATSELVGVPGGRVRLLYILLSIEHLGPDNRRIKFVAGVPNSFGEKRNTVRGFVAFTKNTMGRPELAFEKRLEEHWYPVGAQIIPPFTGRTIVYEGSGLRNLMGL